MSPSANVTWSGAATLESIGSLVTRAISAARYPKALHMEGLPWLTLGGIVLSHRTNTTFRMGIPWLTG
jgi:hypothetical protein